MNETFIHLDLLDSNPYQPRQHEDPEVIQELAENILRTATVDFDGLLQVPTVRAIGGDRYQLAFGHTRKAAFAYLFSQGHERYNIMRVFVRDLSDVQMFEAAVAENIKRRDLNPIEQAESMHRYMFEFKKTSAEAGEFFNCSEENVRAKVRLLNLPLLAKEKMLTGDLNETAARSLLTLIKVIPNDLDALQDAIQDIDDGEKPEEAVEQVLRSHKDTKIIGNESNNSNFPMKIKTFKYLPELTVTEASHHCGVDPKVIRDYHDKGVWQLRIEKLSKGIQAIELPGSDNAEELERMRKIQHLVKPPACTACPLFALIDGTGYCGWVACFDRKKEAYAEAELHKVSEATGIALLTKEDGGVGRIGIVLTSYNDKHRKLFDQKNADLRLVQRGSHNYMSSFHGIPSDMQVVAVGKTAESLKKAQEQSNRDKGLPTEKVDHERLRAIQKINDAQCSIFTWEHAVPAFAKLLDGVTCIDLLRNIDGELSQGDILELPEEAELQDKELEKMKKPAQLDLWRKRIVYSRLDDRMKWDDIQKIHKSKTPVVLFAKHLQELATTWGVKLPKDFLTKAAEHDDAVKLAIAELDKPDKDGAE